MTSPVISIPLDQDVLWQILALNVDNDVSAEAIPALFSLRHASQVCSSWRELTLANSSWWGKALHLDYLRQQTGYWRDEVFRRTGNSLLDVRGDCGGNLGERKFLKNLLETQWNRIRSLYLHRSDTRALATEVLAVCQLPAPHLEAFMVPVVFGSKSELFPSPDFVLFGNIAPSLHIFNSLTIFFDSPERGLCVSQLAEYPFDGPDPIDGLQLVHHLARMPFLEKFQCGGGGLVTLDDSSGIGLPKVALPSLKTLDIETTNSLSNWLHILECITPPDDCNFWLYQYPATVLNPQELEVAARVLAVYSSRYMKAKQAPRLFLHMNRNDFIFRDDNLDWNSVSFAFMISSADIFPDESMSGLLQSLALCQFNAVQELSFSVEKRTNLRPDDSNLANLISLFTSVEILEIQDLNTIGVLLDLSSISTDKSFPALHTIKISFPNRMLSDTSRATTIAEFLSRRISTNKQIRVFDLRKETIDKEELSHNLSFLEDYVGLRVVWDVRGLEKEYICGSGQAEVLDFSRGLNPRL